MGRKAIAGGGKRDEIIETAERLFFEKGFDGVTIRTLQREVGCEVGLFYYYFKSKEEIFDVIVARMEDGWRKDFQKALEGLWDDPKSCLDGIFAAISKNGEKIRRRGGENLHWSVRGGIFDRMLNAAEEYVEKVLEAMGVRDARDMAVVVTGGLGRLALTQRSNDYKERIDYVLEAAGIRGYSYNRRREISVELL